MLCFLLQLFRNLKKRKPWTLLTIPVSIFSSSIVFPISSSPSVKEAGLPDFGSLLSGDLIGFSESMKNHPFIDTKQLYFINA